MVRGLEGQVALVTGAARGQGRSHAVRLAEEGADVIIVDICEGVDSVSYPMPNRDDLHETERLVSELGSRVVAGVVDVRRRVALQEFVDGAVAQLGRLDIVVANAAIAIFGPPESVSDESWNDLIDIDLTGVWNTCKVAIPHLVGGNRGGSIVLISSAAGSRARPQLAPYVAAKHGVIGLMRGLALDLGQHWIRVNAILPGSVDTQMLKNDALRSTFTDGNPAATDEDLIAPLTAINALPIPWLEPRDISNAIAFICSEQGRYITGAALPVDAGLALT